MIGQVYSINRSGGGVPKLPVPAARVGYEGVEADSHNDTKQHGGPNQAVCLYSLEIIEALAQEGHPIHVGSAGENLTVAGIDWATVVPGKRLEVGEAELEVASYTSPCKTIAGSFIDGQFTRISQKLHPGWSRVYARVIREGRVIVGDKVRILGAGS